MYRIIFQVHVAGYLHVTSSCWSRDMLESKEAWWVCMLNFKLHITDFSYLVHVSFIAN